MSGERISIYDTTLRDGGQTQGVTFTPADKAAIAAALDDLGIDYVEGGWPGANPTDDAFFEKPPPLEKASLVAFGMTRREGHSAANDPGLAPLVNSGSPGVCLVGKSWDFHVDVALGVSREENLAMIRDSIAHLQDMGREPLFDAEHFFDGYKANPSYALECLKAALDAGARWIVLCDTNGGTLPHEISRIVGDVLEHVPGDHLGMHAHNDTENAVANSLAAVEAGARQIQGTINGLGERCGNANLVSVIPSLVLKMGYDCGIPADNLGKLTQVARLVDDRLNRESDPHAAYIGRSAFAHKGGLHVSAVEKNPTSYEHVDPASVGNERVIVMSDQAGRSNVLARLADIGIELSPSDKRVRHLIEEVKQRSFSGYSYDGAQASFELLARDALGELPEYFRLVRFRVTDDRRWNAAGNLVTESEATVTLTVAGEEVMTAATGNGPVNALDSAIRKLLSASYPCLADMHLVDYKVRIMPPGPESTGTDAVTCVLIESSDEAGARWMTVGVSANIIDASFNALQDAIVYKLFRDGVAVD